MELENLLSAGIDIKTALDLVAQNIGNKKKQEIIIDISKDVIHGETFSDALKKSNCFSPYEYYSIQIGEETGKLHHVLRELSVHFKSRLKQRKQVISAISYPLVIVLTALLAITFMMYFIVPMFAEIFKRFGGDLPYVTKLIINISAFFSNNIVYILCCLLATIALFFFLRSNQKFRMFKDQLICRIPIIGRIFSTIFITRFCSSMALLIGSDVPILTSIRLVQQMINFYPLNDSLREIERSILMGNSLYQGFSRFKLFDSKMVALIKVGEESNKLGSFFEKLYQSYSEEVEHKTSLLNTVLEPLMIVFLGMVVGFILVAMYLPMFQLSTNIGG
jgi:type IV pilus assembly protein PilC